MSARLETHELVETSISMKPTGQVRHLTRRLHAEHHEMTLDSARLGFALAIPSGATPDFGTSGVKLQWSVRLSFLVIPPSPEAPAPTAPPEAVVPTTAAGASNPAAAAEAQSTLPRTGRPTGPLAIAGSSLSVAGAALLTVRRRLLAR